jgi:N-carbamoylputrescine amidase
VNIGVVQTAAGPNLPVNRERVLSQIAAAFADGAELVVAPELAGLPYFPANRAEADAWAEPMDGPTTAAWHQLAHDRDGYVVGGLLERGPDGALFNTAVLVGPDGLLGVYRKIHLFSWERAWCEAGDHLTLVHLPNGVRVGLLICYDLRFAEAVRSLAEHDMQLLAVPTTWTNIGKPRPWDGAGYCPQAHLAVGHAYAHKIAVACADRVGVEGAVRFLGASLIVAPDGTVAAGPLPPEGEAFGVAAVAVEGAGDKTLGQENHVLRDRRDPEVYQRVVIS